MCNQILFHSASANCSMSFSDSIFLALLLVLILRILGHCGLPGAAWRHRPQS